MVDMILVRWNPRMALLKRIVTIGLPRYRSGLQKESLQELWILSFSCKNAGVNMKASELVSLSKEELVEKEGQLKKQLMQLRFDAKLGKLEKH